MSKLADERLGSEPEVTAFSCSSPLCTPTLGFSKDIYAGTTSLFFTVGNAIKAVPWLRLVKPTAGVWTLMTVCLLAIPLGSGWVGGFTARSTSVRSIAPATDCWS
jgi:hypothetical protein